MSPAWAAELQTPTIVGVAADHGGFDLKDELLTRLAKNGYSVKDFGAFSKDPADDYPDYVIPLSSAVGKGEIWRGIAICASGVGAAMAANKAPRVRSALITDCYSARQGVEDDDMNIICLGGSVTGVALAWDLVKIFLEARYLDEPRFRRRLQKVSGLEF